jgi:hypothetical protein
LVLSRNKNFAKKLSFNIYKDFKMNKILMSSIIFLAGMIMGCNKDATIDPANNNLQVITNTPVIASTQNVFSLTLTAKSYTASSQYDLSFSTDTLACALTVTGQTAGNGILRVIDSNNSVVYADSALSNKVIASTQTGKGIPKNIKLIFIDYTGTINFALSRNGSGK